MLRCYDEIRRWEAQNKEPVNLDVVMANKIYNLEEEERNRGEMHAWMEAGNTLETQKATQRNLSDICEQFGMRDVVNEKKPVSDL